MKEVSVGVGTTATLGCTVEFVGDLKVSDLSSSSCVSNVMLTYLQFNVRSIQSNDI